MGYGDRDYMQPDYQQTGGRPPGLPGPFEGAPVTKWLLMISIATFFLDLILVEYPPLFLRDLWGYYSIDKAILGGQLWRFFTFQFLHADFHHLFFNSIGIFFFGPHIERWMSSRPFLVFYLLCGVAGALFYTVLFFTPGVLESYPISQGMVGASAGIFGILAAFYYVAPDARIYLFFFIPLRMKTFALLIFAFETFHVLFDMSNAGGSAGHLGGAFIGLLIVKNQKGREIVIKLSQIGQARKAKGHIRNAKIIRERQSSPIELSEEIDRILDKISEHGIQSLSSKERETLDKARKK